MLTIGGARQLPSDVRMFSFGRSYEITKEVNTAAQTALSSNTFVLLGKKRKKKNQYQGLATEPNPLQPQQAAGQLGNQNVSFSHSSLLNAKQNYVMNTVC